MTPTIIALSYAGELIDPSAMAGLPSKYSAKDFEAHTGSTYLPYINLMTSQSEECKKGKFPINHFALHGSGDPDDLGDSIDIIPLAWRPKAMDISGKTIVTSYDPHSETFKTITAKAGTANSKCMSGVEFLVWLPKRGKFATFYPSSKSAKKEAPGVLARMFKACSLKPKMCESADYTWFIPTAHDCNTPLDTPPMEDVKEQIEKFNNPPVAASPELAPEAETTGRER